MVNMNGYNMNGEVISVLSLEGQYYNFHERAQRATDNYDIYRHESDTTDIIEPIM